MFFLVDDIRIHKAEKSGFIIKSKLLKLKAYILKALIKSSFSRTVNAALKHNTSRW